MGEWLETYRGVVNPWECDVVQHFTIAYYFDRFADATRNLFNLIGEGDGLGARAISDLTESIGDSQGPRTVIHAVGWQRRPACMTKPLSSDLRERLIEAVAAGMSRRAAADRFGIAASTAVKWVRRWRDTGSNAPRPQGGDKRSDRIEAHAKEILGLVAERHDITLSEMAGHLERRHGERFAASTVWRFLDRHAMTFKKNRARQRAGASGRRRAKTSLARHTGRA